MKRGFTLIELLAVIVILAIIALIVTPIILNIVDDAKNSSNERSIELYLKELGNKIIKENMNGEFNPTFCTINNKIATCDGVDLTIIENDVELNGLVMFANGKTKNYALYIGDDEYIYGNVDKSCFVSVSDGEINDYLVNEEKCDNNVVIPNNFTINKSRIVHQEFNNDKCVNVLKAIYNFDDESANTSCSNFNSNYNNIPPEDKIIFSDNEYELLDETTTITKIGVAAFAAKNLDSIILPKNITEIEDGAFAANNLTNIVIPRGIPKISENCYSTNKIIKVEIPSNIKSIDKYAFLNNSIETVDFGKAINLDSINAYAFYNNSIVSLNLEKATKLKSIGQFAFYSNSLKSIVFPSSLETIGDWAFFSNPNLTSLTIEGPSRSKSLNISNYTPFGANINSIIINTNPNYLNFTNSKLAWDSNNTCYMSTNGDLSTSSCITINN